MQVSVEAASGLQRRMTVSVPKEQVNQEYQTRLKAAARKIKINGFRPGKVPAHVIQQRYGVHIRLEALDEIIKSTMPQALSNLKDVRIASQPQLESMDDKGDNEDFAYTLSFEVYPEIAELVLDGISVDKPVVEITEADVDAMIETLRRQQQTWQRVERAAQGGDRLTVDYTGTIAGETFAGGTSKNEQVILGTGRYLQDFENALISAMPNSTIEVDSQFPADYRHQDVAGKAVHFSIIVHAIEEPVLPEVDATFMTGFGVSDGNIVAMRDEVRNNLTNERNREINTQVKQHLFDALMEKNPIDAPTQLVKDEAKRMADNFVHEMEAQGLHLSQGVIEPERFEQRAETRVKMGLVLNEIVRHNELKPDPARVRSMIESFASSYEDPQAYIDWHYNSPERLADVEASVLEDEIMEWLLERVSVNSVNKNFQELIAARQLG